MLSKTQLTTFLWRCKMKAASKNQLTTHYFVIDKMQELRISLVYKRYVHGKRILIAGRTKDNRYFNAVYIRLGQHKLLEHQNETFSSFECIDKVLSTEYKRASIK